MKFEEILPILRLGREIKRESWDDGQYLKLIDNRIYTRVGTYSALYKDILATDWILIKERVKYYPALIKSSHNNYFTTMNKFANTYQAVDYCFREFKTSSFIRLITEIPELIEERDE